jgi:hypothetical protein
MEGSGQRPMDRLEWGIAGAEFTETDPSESVFDSALDSGTKFGQHGFGIMRAGGTGGLGV